MVAHQTIGIDMTSGLKGLTLCVNIRLRLPTKDVQETRVRGTGSADPQQKLIFCRFLIFFTAYVGFIFLVTRKRLTYHTAITDGIACRPLNYGVSNACESERLKTKRQKD